MPQWGHHICNYFEKSTYSLVIIKVDFSDNTLSRTLGLIKIHILVNKHLRLKSELVRNGSMANCPIDSWSQTVGHIRNIVVYLVSLSTVTVCPL